MENERGKSTDASTGYNWYVVGVLFVVSVLGYIDRVILSFLVEPIKAELKLTDSEIGAVVGLAFAVLYVFGGVLLGRMLDGGRRVLILALCIIVWSIATGVTGLATGFLFLFIARAFVGVGEAGLNPAAMGIISNRFPPSQVQKPIGIFTMGLYVGGGLAMLLGGQLLALFEARGPYTIPFFGEAAPWRLVFVILAVPGLLLAFLMLLTVRDRAPATAAGATTESGPQKISALAFAQRNRGAIFVLAIAVVSWSMNNYGLLNWYPAMLMRTYDMSPMMVANSYGPAFLIGGIAGCLAVTPALAMLRRRWPDNAVHMLCAITLAALSVTTILGPQAPTIPLAITMAFINLFISAMSVTAVYVLLVAVSPNHLLGLYTGLYLALVNLTGGAFGSVIVGLFTDHIFGADGLNHAMSVVALLFGPIAALLMLRASRMPIRHD